MPVDKETSALSARHCRYFESGRCVFEEALNRGLDRNHECRVLRQWEEKMDDFLHRAEVFSLDDETAARLWFKRVRKIQSHLPDCPLFQQDEDGDSIGCVLALHHLCLETFPKCPGRCRRFETGPKALCFDSGEPSG